MSHLLFICTMLCTTNMLDCCCSLESVSCLVLYITDIVTVTSLQHQCVNASNSIYYYFHYNQTSLFSVHFYMVFMLVSYIALRGVWTG